MRKIFLFVLALGVFVIDSNSQSTNDLLNVLVQKNLITPKDADSLRAEAVIAAQAKVKSFPVSAAEKIALSGYTQVRFQTFEESGKNDGFDIRRARLDLKGSISPRWAYRVQLDLAGSPKLIDAYAELKLNDYFNFTFGQAKVPFSLENLISSPKLELIDRSQVVEALTARGKDVVGNQNGRDIGILLGGTLLKLKDRRVLDYRLGVYNGAGINTADNNDNKDIATRLIVHPVSGLDFGAAWYDGSRFIPEVKTDTEVTTPSRTVNRDRLGFDLSYTLKNFSLSGEYILGKDEHTQREGYYVKAGYYVLPGKIQAVAKYDFYDTNLDHANDASTWYVFGANYFFTRNALLQVNYTVKQEEGIRIGNNFANLQIQIHF